MTVFLTALLGVEVAIIMYSCSCLAWNWLFDAIESRKRK